MGHIGVLYGLLTLARLLHETVPAGLWTRSILYQITIDLAARTTIHKSPRSAAASGN